MRTILVMVLTLVVAMTNISCSKEIPVAEESNTPRVEEEVNNGDISIPFNFIKSHEGFVPHVYCDACGVKSGCKGGANCPNRGVPTIGYGFTNKELVAKGTISRQEADIILKNHIVATQWWIKTKVRVPLTDGQLSCLTSFVFNIGRGAFTKSECLKLINTGRLDEVPENILLNWHRGNGIPGRLTSRRKAEGVLWNS